MWSHFDRVVIAVRDLQPAVATYAALLGSAVPPESAPPLADVERAFFVLDNGCVELCSACDRTQRAAAAGTTAPEDRRREDAAEGVAGIVLGCESLELAVATLEARGLRGVAREVTTRPLVTGVDDSTRAREWALDPSQTYGVDIAIRERKEGSASAAQPRGAAAPPQGTVRALDHIVVRTSDPERAIALYRDRLGLRLALDRSFPERHVRLLFFRLAGVTLEVAAPLASPRSDLGDTLWGVAYRVDDPHAAHARIAGAGFEISEVRPGNKPGTAVCTVRGPTHGVPTLVIGPAQTQDAG